MSFFGNPGMTARYHGATRGLVCVGGTTTIKPIYSPDGYTWTVGSAISLGVTPGPPCLAYDGNKALFAAGSNLYPLTLNKATGIWSLGTAVAVGYTVSGGSQPISISRNGLYALVCSQASSNRVVPFTYNVSTGLWVKGTAVTASGPDSVAIAPNGLTALVACQNANQCYQLNNSSGTWTNVATIPLTGSTGRFVSISDDSSSAIIAMPSGTMAYLKQSGGTWSVNTYVATTGLSTPYGLDLSGDGLRAVQCDLTSGTVKQWTYNGSSWSAGSNLTVGNGSTTVLMTGDGLHLLICLWNANGDKIYPAKYVNGAWVVGPYFTVGNSGQSGVHLSRGCFSSNF